MMNTRYLLTGFVAMFAAFTYAEDKVDLTLLKQSLNPTAEIKHIQDSAIPGLYEVQINNQIIYLSADGEKVISGDLYNLKSKKSETEIAQRGLRANALKTIADKDKIIYKAKNEKYKVNIFTDISCPFCTKIHQQVDQFNAAGITVEYLAFPRAGIGSQSAENMQKIWCSKNKTIALTEAKIDNKLPRNHCEGHQVVDQFLLGQDLGINATPTLILSNGEVLSGYIEPDQLATYLASLSTH